MRGTLSAILKIGAELGKIETPCEKKNKILVIAGPTASGKTSLSIQLAKKFSGEIVSADSRQVYRGLDIGTGKVTKDEMQDVPHHLINVANHTETYTVADFVRDGRKTIDEIVARGHLPIVVGGTFFYVDALLGHIVTPEVLPNPELRQRLEFLDTETLYAMIEEKDPRRALNIDRHNRRRLIRSLEIIESVGAVPNSKSEELYDVLTLGISITREKLRANIHKRLVDRMERGMVDEVIGLVSRGLSHKRLRELGIEYQCIADYLDSKCTREETFQLIERKSYQYAKRQMTWLRRNKDIVWMEKEKIEDIEKRGIRAYEARTRHH